MGNGCAGELEKRFGLADEAVKLARPGFAALLLAVAWPWPALAYRPFDSTDAAVADKGVFEIELSPLSYRP